MSNEFVGVSAALLMGLVGSVHCFGMCGGIAGALGMRVREQNSSSVQAQVQAALYQIGRVTGYALMGALFGAIGQSAQSLLNLAELGALLRAASGMLLLLIAARILFRWNGLVPIERLGARLWRVLQPITRRLSGVGGYRTLLLGMLWGFLPCGMVYSMLAFVALNGSAIYGAVMMLAFGLGTAPAMFGSTLLATKSLSVFGSTWAKRATGGLLATFGIWIVIAPLFFPVHGTHVH